MANGPKHTYLTGPWHTCARCARKTKIAEMVWQQGRLVCLEYCFDKELLGDRELRIAEVLNDGKEELSPVEKLQHPSLDAEPDDIVL